MFFVGGFDSTASALSFLSYYLAKNASVQEKLIRELDEAFNGIEPNFDDIHSLVYLDACVKESLRLDPTVNRIERKSVSDCKLGNIFVPKNTYITIPVKAVHRDPQNYEDPDEFRPERFLPENKHMIKSGTYLPFALGARNCVGMTFAINEIKFCFAKLLMRYKLIQCKETEV